MHYKVKTHPNMNRYIYKWLSSMDIQFIFLVSCLAERLKKIMKKMCLWCSFNNMDQNLKRFKMHLF